MPLPYEDESLDDDVDPRHGYGSTLPKWPIMLAVGAALLGCIFSAVSTSDFMQHLDRQVHAIHCSFIPGAGKELGDSGCKTVMMSPYSSWFRQSTWGGVPVSLWSLATFAFLLYRSTLLLLRGKASRPETGFLLAAAGLPMVMTFIYGYLSIAKVGTTCKVCVGIYLASLFVFIGVWLTHRNNPAPTERYPATNHFALWFSEGVGFVLALTVTYLVFAPAPDVQKAMVGCGSLVSADDPNSVMLPLATGSGEPAIEVLDPLCPACKAFDERLGASSLHRRLNLRAVLFPLDSACNWMVTQALHPGACAVSEAMLCAAGLSGTKDEKATQAVLQWAFTHQEQLRELAAKDENALRAKIESAFPKVKGCLGGTQVKSKLTKSLRWAVSNAIPVLTPQLFVGNSRMCDEDSDLGLEFTLNKMLSKQGQLARAQVKPPPKPPPTIVPVALPKPAAAAKPAARPAPTGDETEPAADPEPEPAPKPSTDPEGAEE
jgi:uncharacterized membrane protein